MPAFTPMQTKTFRAHVKALDETQGILEAIVSVFNNVDSDNEKILPGYFTDSLKERTPKGVWMHKWDQPVAKTLECKELLAGDPLLPDAVKSLGGLYIKGQFNLDTQRGKEAFSDITFGIVDEFSVGISTTKWAYDEESDVRELIAGDLFEWSPVLVGSNDMTQLMSAKAANDLPFGEHFKKTGTEFRSLLKRASWKAERKASKKLSAVQLKELEETLGEMEEMATEIRELIASPGQIEDSSELGSGEEAEAATSVTPEEGSKAFAAFLLTQARMNGVAI